MNVRCHTEPITVTDLLHKSVGKPSTLPAIQHPILCSVVRFVCTDRDFLVSFPWLGTLLRVKSITCYLLDGLLRGHMTTGTEAVCRHVVVDIETSLLTELQLHKRPRLQYTNTTHQLRQTTHHHHHHHRHHYVMFNWTTGQLRGRHVSTNWPVVSICMQMNSEVFWLYSSNWMLGEWDS